MKAKGRGVFGFLPGLPLAPVRDLASVDRHNVPESPGAYILLAVATLYLTLSRLRLVASLNR